MKKSTKIFAIVLTLALVLGVFAIGASAALGHNYAADIEEGITGETVNYYFDFEGCEEGVIARPAGNNTYFTTKALASNGKSVTIDYKTRDKLLSIEKAEKGLENQYLAFVADAGSGAQYGDGAYMNMSIQPGLPTPISSEEALETVGVSISELKYQIIDLDIYYPQVNALSGGRADIHFEFRGYDASGARKTGLGAFGYTEVSSMGMIFSKHVSQDKMEFYHNYTGQYNKWVEFDMPVGEWVHLTYIAAYSVNNAGTPEDTSDDYIDLTYYTIENGEILYVYSPAFAQDSTKFYNGDMTKIFVQDVRLGFGDPTREIYFDNIAIRTYDKNYDDAQLAGVLAQGVGADLTDWDRCAYDAADMPMGQTAGAMIGDVEYSNLAQAVKNANKNDVITLLADSNDKILVNKNIEIETNGFEVNNLATADGYSVVEEDGVIAVIVANDYLTVEWKGCDCGEDCYEEGITHVYTGNNIYDSYKKTFGHDPVCKGTEQGLSVTKHTGFEDDEGILDECGLEFSKNLVATEDLEGETIVLVPTYEEDSIIAIRTDKDGNETKIWASVGLTDAACKWENGVTITLMANITAQPTLVYGGQPTVFNIGNYKDVTFDLNGKRLAYVKEGPASERAYIFVVTADGFTLTSSQPGGAVYNAVKTAATKFQSNPTISHGSKGSTMYIDGQNDKGETTLSIYTGMVYRTDTKVNLVINGGRYIGGGATDSMGLFYAAHVGTYTANDAYFDGGNSVFYFGGKNKDASYATFTNCVFGTATSASATCFAELTVIFDGCYIGGNINDKANGVGAGYFNPATNPNATHIIKNSYLKSGITANAVYADGQTAHSINMTKEFEIVKNNWKAEGTFGSEATLATATETVTMTFDKMIADANLQSVNVEWYDGETLLGTSTAMPGTVTNAPAFGYVEGTNNMVGYTYTEWNENTEIKLGTTGTVKFTLKENAEPVYVAGKVNVMFNFEMTNHFAYNFYIPEAPEAVTYVSAQLGGANPVSLANMKFTYTDNDGVKYHNQQTWPGTVNAATDMSFAVTYTYKGQEITFNANNVSIPKYAVYVVTSEKYDGMPIQTAMADLVRGMKEALEAEGKPVDSYITNNWNVLEPYMSSLVGAVDKDAVNDLSEVEDYIEGVYFKAITPSNAPHFCVEVKDGYAVIFDAITIYGMNSASETRFQNNMYYAHNIRSCALNEVYTFSIYKVEDVEKIVANQNKIQPKEGATALASATITASGIVNADTGASAAYTEFYNAYLAYAKSADAYMQWRHEVLGKAPKYQ